MSWLSSWFSPKTSNQGRTKALSVTQEAFSMPSSGFPSHHEAYNVDTLNTPDPDSAVSPSYTYPPPSSAGSYGYVPTGASSRSRPASLLPLHHSPLTPLPPYPSLEQTWNRLRTWLNNEYPELGDTLNYGILPQDLSTIEMQFGFALPQAVRESYLVVDGQEPESSAGCADGLFFGLHLLPLEEVFDEWRFWREVDNDPNSGAHEGLREAMQSIPPGWVRKEYSQRGWIPLISDKTGNYVGVDLNPGEGGSVGQVIVFGRDFDTKVVLWRGDGPAGWARWLASFVEELESGEGFELGVTAESEGSEDDVGYESYFYDGTGRGSGDGGGEAGAGGMRLTGEYRGWNVLEAWADKSLRRWHGAGLVPEPAITPQDKGKAPERSEVLNLAKTTGALGAEVPIPVLTDVSNTTRKLLDTSTSKDLPVISVTKPPAPLPVGLPTQTDIEPEFDGPADDLESGAGAMMRELPDAPLTTRLPPRSLSKPRPAVAAPKEAALIPLPSSDEPSPPSSSAEPRLPLAAAPLADITDLLADSANGLETKPIEPSPSPSSSPRRPSVIPEATPLPNGTASVSTVDGDADPETTIRLVGGGGTSGTLEEAKPSADQEAPESEINNLVDTSPVAPNGTSTPKSEKKKSILGLQKLGQLAGKRKKDLVTSLQETN